MLLTHALAGKHEKESSALAREMPQDLRRAGKSLQDLLNHSRAPSGELRASQLLILSSEQMDKEAEA